MTCSLGPPTTQRRNVADLMSKKTDKRKTNARRKKANHGTKPNAGRG
ncbi:MAG: hypothetical protein ACR2LA_07660 [Acidimicrobiales bacterium]